MKIQKLILVAIFCTIGLVDCKKDDNSDSPSNLSGSKLSKVTFGNESSTFQYDGKGRLSKISHGSGAYTTLEYSASTVVIKEFNEQGIQDNSYWTYTLNSKGLATTCSYNEAGLSGKIVGIRSNSHLKNAFTILAASDILTTYEYDANGFLIKEVYPETNETKNYVISNGNVVSSFGTWEWGYENTYQYLANSTNTIFDDDFDMGGNENIGIYFMGKRNTNLISAITERVKDEYGTFHTYQYSYSYEFDSKNRVTKKTSSSQNDSYVTTYTYIN